MNRYRSIYQLCVLSLLFSIGLQAVFAQTRPVKVKAPKVEDRRPPSEKLAEKPFTIKRKLVQNLVTRYNYYYHAKLRLDGVTRNINRQGQDNFNVLLPFYPYSPQNMGLSTNELDSVVYKASVAIQIHDPRGKWIDDCYLLIGRAYYYMSDWDNANKTFQFVNTTFAPRKKDDYKVVIGSQENDQITVASKEKRKGFFGRFKHIYARNDAFLWRARTLIEQKDFDEVQSLLSVLETDPNFPKRLDGQLAEVQAYSRYSQGRYAESIAPLQEAIKKSRNKDEKTRMAYILAQLYVKYQRPDSAMNMFRKVIKLKPDPVMDFQARMEIARINATANGGGIEESIAALRKMARKEKYIRFRDAIYYTMAVIIVDKDPDAAVAFLKKGLTMESTNPIQKVLSYKALADIYYYQRAYMDSRNYYDSTASTMPPGFPDSALIVTRKNVLSDVAAKIATIQREDSLLYLATLPDAARNTVLEEMAAGIRKQAEEKRKAESKKRRRDRDNTDAFVNNNNILAGNNPTSGPPVDDKGDWYFYNTASKASGFSEFKRRWGNRALSDNWRRSNNGTVVASNNNDPMAGNVTTGDERTPGSSEGNAPAADSVTAQSLAAGLPLTPEKQTASRNAVMDARFDLGKLYYDKLDNGLLAIETYDTLLVKHPDHPKKPEVVYSLYVWHNALNHTAAAKTYKDRVLNQHGNTNFAQIIQFGALKDIDADKKKKISTAYDSAYVAYLAGNYTGALDRKREADSSFGYNFLQPKFDLLEAMAIIKTDTSNSRGIAAVKAVIDKYPAEEGIRNQAQQILDALHNKDSIVTYLTGLTTRRRDTTSNIIDEDISIRYPWQHPQPKFDDSVRIKTAGVKDPAAIDNKAAIPNVVIKTLPPPKPVTPYKLNANNPHFVVLLFKRVSKAIMDQGLEQFARYNAAKHAADKIEVGSFVLTPTETMLIFRLFENEEKALQYYDEIRDEAQANIIPRIPATDYTLFVISRDNFILMNNTKDLQGYQQFFKETYITE